MNVPFLDLKAINARHAAELKAATARVIDSGWYILGEEVKAFESEFAAWVGSPHCVGTSDGLSALILALRGWKELGLLKDGDGVAVPANTYIASILAITENRLRPVLVEPDEDTCNLGAGKLAAALTPDVKAVLAVHLYGQLADMPAIAQLSVEMDRQDRLYVRRKRGRELTRAEIARIFIGLDKHRTETVLRDGQDRGDVGIRRDRDAVAVLEQAEFLPAAEGENERRETVGGADAVRRADPSGEL